MFVLTHLFIQKFDTLTIRSSNFTLRSMVDSTSHALKAIKFPVFQYQI